MEVQPEAWFIVAFLFVITVVHQIWDDRRKEKQHKEDLENIKKGGVE